MTSPHIPQMAVIDTEYTHTGIASLTGSFPRIWEIAALRCDGATYTSLVKAPMLEPFICELCQVEPDIATDARPWTKVQPEFMDFMFGFMPFSWGLTDFFLCALHDSQYQLKGVASLNWRELRGYVEGISQIQQPRGLRQVCKSLGLPYPKTHRALDDCKAAYSVVTHYEAVPTSTGEFKVWEV